MTRSRFHPDCRIPVNGDVTLQTGDLFRAIFSNSCGDVATTAAMLSVRVFTDATLSPGVTPVRAIHILELRTRVSEQRARFGLGSFPWTDSTLTGATIRAAHVIELREALRQAYVEARRSVPVYTDPTITPGVTMLKAVHIQELRTAVVALE